MIKDVTLSDQRSEMKIQHQTCTHPTSYIMFDSQFADGTGEFLFNRSEATSHLDRFSIIEASGAIK